MKSPERGQKTYFDEALSGFGIRISQGGSKSFVIMYGNKRRLKTIGRYPDIGLADARKEAKRALAELTLPTTDFFLGSTPLITFGEARDRFLRDSDARNKEGTAREYRRLLNRHFEFDKQLSEVRRADIMSVVEQLNNTPSEAQHAFVAIRTMMNWCHTQGLIEASPVPRMTFKTEARSRILSDVELKAVWLRAGEVGGAYGNIVQLLILTGQRRGEVGGLRGSWISDCEIVYPPGFTKNKREHLLPIGKMTKTIFEKLNPDSGLVFPSRVSVDKQFNGWSKCKKQFDEPLDMPPYTLHDLRRTYSSNLARLGVPIHVTEKLLNHVSGTVSGIAAVYNRHSYIEEMKVAIAKFDVLLTDIIKE